MVAIYIGINTSLLTHSPWLQLQASYLLTNLSKSLVSLTLSGKVFTEKILQASTPIIDAASNIIKVSSNTSKQVQHNTQALVHILIENHHFWHCFHYPVLQKEISSHLLNTVDNVQSALLAGKKVNQEPIILRSSVFGLYVNR